MESKGLEPGFGVADFFENRSRIEFTGLNVNDEELLDDVVEFVVVDDDPNGLETVDFDPKRLDLDPKRLIEEEEPNSDEEDVDDDVDNGFILNACIAVAAAKTIQIMMMRMISTMFCQVHPEKSNILIL